MRGLRALLATVALAACKSTSDNPVDAGGGGAAGCPTADDLISDFAVDNGVSQVDGRQGGWYTYGDSLGVFANAPKGYNVDFDVGNAKCSGIGSLHVKGTGFADYGAATGVDFKLRSP